MPAQPTEGREGSTTGSEPSRAPGYDSDELSTGQRPQAHQDGDGAQRWAKWGISGLTLVGIGLALVSAGIYWFDAGRMVDLTDEGIALLQARPHDANEILPSPFARVTAPMFWLVRHDLAAFRIASFLILAVVAAVLIGLTIRSRTRGRVGIAITGGIAAAAMHYAEYLRTANYNWVVGMALGLVAIGLVIVIAPPKLVEKWEPWHRDLIGGSILGFGIALTLTARVHSAIGAAIVVAAAVCAWSLRLHARGQRPRLVLTKVLRVTAASVSTCALWVIFALVLPAGGLGPLRRDVRNGVDWLNVNGSRSTGDLSHYAEDVREFFRAIATSLREQAPGVAIGLLLAVLFLCTVLMTARPRRGSRERLAVSSNAIVALMTGAALGGAVFSGLARGEFHAGPSPTASLGTALLGLVIWAVVGRFVGVASVAFLARQVNERARQQISVATAVADGGSETPGRSARSGWILLTATLVGLALAVSVGSGNSIAYQLHYGSVLLLAALACVVGLRNGGGRRVAARPRGELPAQLLIALLCVTFGLFALRCVLDARTVPYRQSPLSTATKSFHSSATGLTVELPPSVGRGLEQLEREARRAGWRPGTSLLDLTPFHPTLTFWLGADPPFSVYPAVDSGHATDSLLLTISRESEDDLKRAWLLVSSPLLDDIDYSAIASALGRPWPCGYEPAARANVGSSRVELLRPTRDPVPRTCPG